ncbi:hypothetical protein [Leucobacter japonicus]|uniref:hypothetical protein n=1 Tax=Leucobacter japonicus TaxID=1461259 RepID=UPI0012E205EA|nr:hypothetical protein [Leucobacter japonicus]
MDERDHFVRGRSSSFAKNIDAAFKTSRALLSSTQATVFLSDSGDHAGLRANFDLGLPVPGTQGFVTDADECRTALVGFG